MHDLGLGKCAAVLCRKYRGKEGLGFWPLCRRTMVLIVEQVVYGKY